MKLVVLEWSKMRRLKLGWLLAILTIIVAGWTLGAADRGSENAAVDLLGLGITGCLTGPLFMAVIASRQVGPEHHSGGWLLYGTSGVRFSQLILAKIAALAPLVAVAQLLAVGVVWFGLGAPGGVGHWVAYAGGLVLVSVLFLAFHVIVASVVDNQLISIGLGALGSFIALYCALMPVWVARLLPWGYFVLILPSSMTEDGVIYSTPYWGSVAVATVVAVGAMVLILRRLDTTKEN